MVEHQAEYTDNIPVTNSQQLNFSIHCLHMNTSILHKQKNNLLYVNELFTNNH